MSEMKIVHMRLNTLIPYDKNPRKNDAAVPKMVKAFTEFGFRVPILAKSNGEIIDGHLRYKAAQKMGLDEVPVIIADDMTETQIHAFRISINKSAEWADWDMDLLLAELQELHAADYNLEFTGFDEKELDQLFREIANDKDPDKTPPKPEKIISKTGDVWNLGQHRLMCGDCCDCGAINLLMNDELLDMVWTDPPYGVNYVENKKILNAVGKGIATQRKIESDNYTPDQLLKFLEVIFQNFFEKMQNGAPIYVAYASQYGAPFYNAFINTGFKLQVSLVWIKNNFTLSRQDYQPMHEPILYGWKPGKHKWYGGRKEKTVHSSGETKLVEQIDGSFYLSINERIFIIHGQNIEVEAVEPDVFYYNKPEKSKLHPTMKPVELIERMLTNSSKRGDIVGDFFGGSGSTLIACERCKRKARIMEKDPFYVDTIIRRWQEYSGKEAIRETDGLTYNELLEAKNG